MLLGARAVPGHSEDGTLNLACGDDLRAADSRVRSRDTSGRRGPADVVTSSGPGWWPTHRLGGVGGRRGHRRAGKPMPESYRICSLPKGVWAHSDISRARARGADTNAAAPLVRAARPSRSDDGQGVNGATVPIDVVEVSPGPAPQLFRTVSIALGLTTTTAVGLRAGDASGSPHSC